MNREVIITIKYNTSTTDDEIIHYFVRNSILSRIAKMFFNVAWQVATLEVSNGLTTTTLLERKPNSVKN